jgi:ADP-ribose pyrophosphatase YjhB (NUDIX family)
MGELDTWRSCPRCRSELERPERGKLLCESCGLTIYASSKPTASALVLDDGRVLLARRAREPDAGKWDLPGGFLDEDEHPLDALKRELQEEAALEIEPLDLFDVVIDRYGDADDAPWTLNLYWTARVVSGEPQPDDDVAELRWFGPDELPQPEELAFRNNYQVLSAWREQQA